MSCDLVVPFRFGDGERDAVWAYVRRHYLDAHPGLRITVGNDPGEDEWSKGRAVANGVARTRQPILIIADADVIVSPEALGYSIIAVMHGAPWSQPHGVVYRLSRRYTNIALHHPEHEIPIPPDPKMVERQHPGPHGGGMVVLTRAAYAASGGIDPRFVGFGGDDISWARALDTLVGPCQRFDHPMLHLWHTRTHRRAGNRGSEANEALAARYMIADNDTEEMQCLVDEYRVSAA